MGKNYYDILGVSKEASVDEIKKAFRRQAVKHHPDRGGDEAKFKEINEAYEVLSNPEKKQRYDQFGQAGVDSNFGAGSQFRGADFSFDFGAGFGDILSSLFGQSQPGRRVNLDIEAVVELTFKEAIFGVEKEISLKLKDICKTCKGSRAAKGSEPVTCSTCKGQGQQIRIQRTVLGQIQQATICQDCQGQGAKIDKPCLDCQGQGVNLQNKDLKLTIPAGIEDGATIRLREHGERDRQGRCGDLYVIVQVKPDKKFTREGSLVLSQEKISISQAVLGSQVEVETVDGSVTIRVPAGTQSGTDFKIPKHGAPQVGGRSRGDHIVSLQIDVPSKLNRQQKQALQDLADSGL